MLHARAVYHRVSAAAPAVLLSVGWWLIWLLWPQSSPRGTPVRTREAVSIRFARLPDGRLPSALASEVALLSARNPRTSDDSDDLAAMFSSPTRARSTGLPWDLPTSVTQQGLCRVRLPLFFCRVSDYAWPSPQGEKEGLATPTEEEPALVLEGDPCLQVGNLRLPDPVAHLPVGVSLRGHAVFHVEGEPDGPIAHVFLEKGTGHRDLDRTLIRWVEQGILTNARDVGSGRLVVNIRIKASRGAE